MAAFIWRVVSATVHVATLGDINVARVSRRTERSHWQIDVLGSRDFDQTFRHHDPRDLESTKSAAEARVKWAVWCLNGILTGKIST